MKKQNKLLSLLLSLFLLLFTLAPQSALTVYADCLLYTSDAADE